MKEWKRKREWEMERCLSSEPSSDTDSLENDRIRVVASNWSKYQFIYEHQLHNEQEMKTTT